MKKDIRILYLEDVPSDVVMVNHELRKAGFAFRAKRVETREAFVRELEHQTPDLILSDHGLPSFDGFSALAVAKERCPDVPFIFVTDSLGEEMTIRTFENGATDYVLKRNLAKLVPVVQRALREAEQRVRLRQKEQELRDSEERYRRLVEICPDALLVVQSNGQIVFADRAAASLLGEGNPDQLLSRPIAEIFEAGRWTIALDRIRLLREQGVLSPFVEENLVRSDGQRVAVELSATPMVFQNQPAMQVIAHDLTKRKQAEEALRQSESRKAAILGTALDAIIFVDANGLVQEWNPAAQRIFGYTPAQAVGRLMDELIIPSALLDVYRDGVANYLMTGAGSLLNRPIEMTLRRADGSEFRAEVAITRVRTEDPSGCVAIIRDITGRQPAKVVK